MISIVSFILGLTLGAGIILILAWFRKKDMKVITKEVIEQHDTQKTQNMETVITQLKEAFGDLSLKALSKNTEEFLKFAKESLSKQTELGEKNLEGKKKLIDQTLNNMKSRLEHVQNMVSDFEKDREKKFGELTTQLKFTAEQTSKLQETANQLRTVLASSKARGQWGERMAEDVLRLAGFVEGVNYKKQKSLEKAKTRPDYTFLLPQNLKLNMDVKFPLDNYVHYLEEDNEGEKKRLKQQFMKDVRARIKDVTTKEYINPADKTVDYVLVFIPNEQVYAFINESDRTIIDNALRSKVVLCSPVTLYAILAVIRQAIDNFSLEKAASEILALFGSFNKQWVEFKKSMDKMGRRIDDAQKEFHILSTTRQNQLEKPLQKIEDLRKQQGIISDSDLEENKEVPFEDTPQESEE
jgi:DNA recombination protein RmuC